MKVTIEGSELVIRIPIENPPQPSSSGKTLVVVSSRGNVTTSALVDGKPIVVGLNAYIKKSFATVWIVVVPLSSSRVVLSPNKSMPSSILRRSCSE